MCENNVKVGAFEIHQGLIDDLGERNLDFVLESRKICLMTHAMCMDGANCAILANYVFKDRVDIKFCSYSDVDEKYEEVLKSKKYDLIIFADMSLVNSTFEKETILIDHHATAAHFHDPENMKFVYNDRCGSYLLKTFLMMVTKKQLKKFDVINVLSDDYDRWIHEYSDSAEMKKIFTVDGIDSYINQFRDGLESFNSKHIESIAKWNKQFQDHLDNTEITLDEDIAIVASKDFMNETCDHIFKTKEVDFVIYIFPKKKEGTKFSIRVRGTRSDINIGEILRKVCNGGGHSHAGGSPSLNDENLEYSLTEIITILKKK